jgi:hypothetical protein
MKYVTATRRLVPIILFFVLVGCAHPMASEEATMYTLASDLTKLSAAMESAVAHKHPPAELTEEQLLDFATRHDPSLLEPFSNYQLKVVRDTQHALVLVCTKDGQHALLEDASCTSKLDKHLWNENPPRPCEFTLELEATCAGQ